MQYCIISTKSLSLTTVIGILGIAFLASIVLVTILLPNIYFRVMLFTDSSVMQQRDDETMRPVLQIDRFEEQVINDDHAQKSDTFLLTK